MKFLKPALWLKRKLAAVPLSVRATIYRTVAPIVPALAGAGFISDGTAQLVLVLLSLVLGTGAAVLAAANTPKPSET
jgi:hypothetical protein